MVGPRFKTGNAGLKTGIFNPSPKSFVSEAKTPALQRDSLHDDCRVDVAAARVISMRELVTQRWLLRFEKIHEPHRSSRLTSSMEKCMSCRVKPMPFITLIFAIAMTGGMTFAQTAREEGNVTTEPVPPQVVASAVAAVAKLGDEVVLGRYQVAVERMNPLWKERAAKRMGGMAVLETQLASVAAQMVQQGISIILCKPQGQPRSYEVAPGMKSEKDGAANVDKLVFSKWLVLVPTVRKIRIMREGNPKPLVIESIGYQVAICDKGKNDWTFIDGAGLQLTDLRGMFGTLPQNLELPPVEQHEAR
jgi:hypothetical protein